MFTHYELMLLQAVERERDLVQTARPRRDRRMAIPRWVRLAGRRAERAARQGPVQTPVQTPVQAHEPIRTRNRAPAPPPASTRDPAVPTGQEIPTASRRPAGTLAACAASGGQIR